MTNESLNKPIFKASDLVAAANLAAKTEDPLAGLKDDFEAEVKAESVDKLIALEEARQKTLGFKNISDLTEDDAYNLEVGIAASAMASPDFLKLDLLDSSYVARWGNTNAMRQGQLRAKGFQYVSLTDLANSEAYEQMLDSTSHITWHDLVALKIPKNIYYAGLRRAYLKSLHATNDKKAREAGATFAKSDLTSQLRGAERSYLAAQEANSNKPIYQPNVGV